MTSPRPPVTVTVAIPTFRREEVLVDTIEQVLRQEPPADEVLVVDQTERHEPATDAYLRRQHDAGRIRWLHHRPAGLPGARNRALAEATSEVVLFIDDDVRLGPDFVGRHAANFADESVVAVAGRVEQRLGWRMAHRQRPWPRQLDYLYFRLDGNERVRGIANFPGANHSIRRAAAVRLGGYDENYVGWALREESDLALRVWKAGGVIVFDPTARLLHLQAPSGGCRYDDEAPTPDWMVALPPTYFAMRHLFPRPQFWKDVLFLNVVYYVARKQNVFRPWRLPKAISDYVYAVRCAARLARARARASVKFPLAATDEGRVRAKE